jgi:hypothetical protein
MVRRPLTKSKLTNLNEIEKKKLISEIAKAHAYKYSEYRRYPSDRLGRPRKRTTD